MSQMSVGREATHSPAPQAADGAPSRRRWLVLSVLAAVAFMAQLDLFIVNVALPTIGAELPQHPSQRPVLGAQRLRDRVRGLLVPMGRLADHFGRKRFLLWASLPLPWAPPSARLPRPAGDDRGGRGPSRRSGRR